MRAYATDRFGELKNLTLRDLPKPWPAAGELLVEVHAAALNPADLKVLSGSIAGRMLHAGGFPMQLGYDFSGVVAELGAGVSGFSVGDEVFGFLPYARSTKNGTFAEQVAVSAAQVGRKSKAISHEEAAAAATAGITALQALRDKGRLTAGQSVLVNGGSGGVGSFAVQIAKNLGANVTALASAAKGELVKSLGADQVLDYAVTPIAKVTGAFDLVFDVVSSASAFGSMRLLKPGGAFLTLLPSPGLVPGLVRALFTSRRCAFVITQPLTRDFEQLTAWFDAGKLKSQLDKTHPFEDVPQALERLRSGQVRGKVAITVRG